MLVLVDGPDHLVTIQEMLAVRNVINTATSVTRVTNYSSIKIICQFLTYTIGSQPQTKVSPWSYGVQCSFKDPSLILYMVTESLR